MQTLQIWYWYIYYGIDILRSHLVHCRIFNRRSKHAKSQKDTKDNNVDRMIQQSVAKENVSTSSYCNSTYWQTGH